MLLSLHATPAPYGGAVRLQLTSTDAETEHALILATTQPDVPDPVTRDDARLVHYGSLRAHAGGIRMHGGQGAYTVMDLDTTQLPDGESVWYHAWTILPGGGHSAPLTVAATPGCVRQTTVRLARDLVKGRLQYHLSRGVRDGAIPVRADVIPVLEQETLEEGFNLPAVLIKETVSPNPSGDTIGAAAGDWLDEPGGTYHRESTFSTQVRVDLMVLTADAEQRARMEEYVHGVLVQDRDYYHAAGLEGTEVQRAGRHDIDPAGQNYWSVELTLTGNLDIRMREEMTTASV